MPAISEYDEKELERAKSLISDLLDTHWRGVMTAVGSSDDSTGSVSIGLKLDHSGTSRLVKSRLSYSVKTSDESEYIVRNPQQQEMSL